MPTRERIELQAIVTKALPNCMFRVKIEGGREPLVYLSGKMKINDIKVLIGDIVTVELSPYDLDRGRIIFRKR